MVLYLHGSWFVPFYGNLHEFGLWITIVFNLIRGISEWRVTHYDSWFWPLLFFMLAICLIYAVFLFCYNCLWEWFTVVHDLVTLLGFCMGFGFVSRYWYVWDFVSFYPWLEALQSNHSQSNNSTFFELFWFIKLLS